MSAAPDQEKDNGLNWKVIRETLDELIDFSKPKADNDVVDKFIARIIPQGNNRFTWFINVSGKSTEEIDMIIEGRKIMLQFVLMKKRTLKTMRTMSPQYIVR